MQSITCIQIGVLAIVIFCTVHCSAIQCYHCSSFHDEECGDPVSPNLNVNELSSLVDCGALVDGHNYTFCRKTVQNAILKPDKETTRVIRSCGFLEEPKLTPKEGDDPAELRCYRRTGTYGVELLYCACHADGCNPASMNVAGMGSVFLLALFAFAY